MTDCCFLWLCKNSNSFFCVRAVIRLHIYFTMSHNRLHWHFVVLSQVAGHKTEFGTRNWGQFSSSAKVSFLGAEDMREKCGESEWQRMVTGKYNSSLGLECGAGLPAICLVRPPPPNRTHKSVLFLAKSSSFPSLLRQLESAKIHQRLVSFICCFKNFKITVLRILTLLF